MALGGKSRAEGRVYILGDTKGFRVAMRKATWEAATFQQKMMMVGGQMKKVGASMTRHLTLPLAAVAGISVKVAADFDKAMTESLAIMGDLEDGMREKMEKTAREVAKSTVHSHDEIAKSYFYLASAGLTAEQSIAALPAVAKFAQAGAFDMAQATDLLTDAQSALGLQVKNTTKNLENMTRVGDVLVKANVLANATTEQFSTALTNKAGAALRLLNKDIEEGVAVLAVYANQGLKGEAAGTALAIVLRDLQKATLNSSKAWKKAGLSVYDADGKMRNMADIIGDLEGYLDGMSDKQKKVALAQLGFTEKSIAATQALIGESDAISKYEKELRDAGGTTEDVAAKQMESFSAKMQVLKSQLTDVGITIGTALIPHLEKLGGWLSRGAEWFSNLSEGQQRFILIAAGVVAALGPVLSILGSVITSLKLMGAAITFATGPVGLIITGIALLVTGLILLYRKNETFRNIVNKVWSAVKTVVVAVVKAAIGYFKAWVAAIKWVVEKFRALWNWIKAHKGPIIAALKVMFAPILAAISSVQTLIGWLKQAYDWIKKLDFATPNAGGGKGSIGRGGPATGGLTTGPITGYSATLHGTELVLPLNGNVFDPKLYDYGTSGGGSTINVNVVLPGGTTLIGTAREVGDILAPYVARALGTKLAQSARRR